jgi:tetratricopeptide (TPR) repeat protein
VKTFAAIALSAALLSTVPDALMPMVQASNSKASSQRGREAFVEGDFENAVRELGVAAEIRPGPEASFDLGTARIAAGDTAGGLQSLTGAFEDDALSTDVRYNAGWAALGVRDWDSAIREYEEVLRDRPGDGNAKRNLEIALRRKEESQQQPEPQPQSQSGPPDQNEDEDEDDGQPPPQGETPSDEAADVDSILRSVEQQEKEELERMRRSHRGRKADW